MDRHALDLEAMAAELRRLRAEIEALRESSRDDSRPVELDQAMIGRLSRIDAMQRQAMAQAAGRRRGDLLARIDAALARIDSGDFGECVRCGDEIDPRRLQVDPTTTLCIACARGRDSDATL
jgi:DnaK suppressor protein